MPRPASRRGVVNGPESGFTAPPSSDQPSTSRPSRRAVCCRCRRPMTSRPSPGSRCTATSTSKSPRRSTRCPSSSSADTCRPRADSELVKLYSVGGPAGAGGGRLVKTHPRQRPGGRSTDPADLPEHQAGYAMRDLTRLIAVCAGHGLNVGIYAERLLDDPLPWTRMRSVYRLQGLVSRYGPEPVDTACGRALDLDVVAVSKIAAMLAKAPETQQPQLPAAAGSGHHAGGGRHPRFFV